MRQNGIAFIEVLISLFILTIGLLGLALLQVNALKQQQESEYRILAASQINEMADRMRANPSGVESGAYNSITSNNSSTLINCNPCSASQLASQDAYQWNQKNSQLLPSGQGQVTAVGNNAFDIIIRWDALKNGVTGTACSKNLNVDLACMTMRIQL